MTTALTHYWKLVEQIRVGEDEQEEEEEEEEERRATSTMSLANTSLHSTTG